MDADERDIFNYLKTWGSEFVGVREICRRAGTKKRFHENPEWAKPILQLMTERSILERDILGRYRVKPKPKHGRGGRWVSPDIEKLLKENGVEVESNSTEINDDEHYEQL
jgi:hypothetical protein